jgi:hypothetical protein
VEAAYPWRWRCLRNVGDRTPDTRHTTVRSWQLPTSSSLDIWQSFSFFLWKAKVVPTRAMRWCRGNRRIAPLILNLVIDSDGWLDSLLDRFNPRAITSVTRSIWRWMSPWAGLEVSEEKKNVLPLSGIEPRFPGCPIRNTSLHWRCCQNNKLQRTFILRYKFSYMFRLFN